MAVTVKGPGGGGSAKFPTGIKVITPPTKTTYKAGESINTAGIVVYAVWSDKSETDITGECTFSPAAGSVVYEQTKELKVSWTWKNMITYETTQTITVTRVLKSIDVSAPTKKTYYKGEALNLAEMKVTAHYTSGATEDVTTNVSTSPEAGTILSSYGDVNVNVNYEENGVTKTGSFTVNVTVKIVTWANGTDAEIVDMVAAADAGMIKLSDYWAVGQERKVNLSAMATTYVREKHVAQTVTMVLMHAGGKVLSNGKTCNFIVGQKSGLANGTSGENGYMNETDTNSGGWEGCVRRKWCNDTYYKSIPASIRPIFKQHKNITANGSSTAVATSIDYFALPAEKEVFGSNTYGNSTAEASLFQFEYYKTSSNRVKKRGDSGSAGNWWERSPHSGSSISFCFVNPSGSANNNIASYTRLLAPFGCI